MRLTGAVALVTGGSSGIGAAVARALSAAGARLLIAGRDEGRLHTVASQTGGMALPCELASATGATDLATAALRAAASLAPARAGMAGAPGIDILVNNAGVGWAGPLGEITAAKVAELVAVNLTAPMELTRLLAPGMAARHRGRVVFVSSIAGITGVRGEAVYSATKAGLAAFAESLSYELAGDGVRACVIVPGVIDTPFFDRRGRPYERRRPAPIPPERVARAVVSCLEHDRVVAYVPGWMRGPAWLHGVAPGVFRALAARFG
jgi:short-subunit dehydrogenase